MPQFRKRQTKRAQELRNNPTQAERRLWGLLGNRRLNGHKFIRQASIGPFFCDFLCRERALVVELDGGHHSEQVEYDSKRTEYLELEGFKVLRFWNSDVMANTEAVLEAILAQIERLPPKFSRSHPQPPPASGRGLS